MINLLPESEAARETWQAVIDLTRRRPAGWTLVGAQMVVLHGLERGRVLPRLTADADLLIDVRLVAGGICEVSSELVDAGFELSDPDPLGVAHRFRRGKAILIKARAVAVSEHPHDQRRDMAFLLSLLGDPRASSSQLRGRERAWLRRRVELLDPDHPAWVGLEAAEDGRLALDTLLHSGPGLRRRGVGR